VAWALQERFAIYSKASHPFPYFQIKNGKIGVSLKDPCIGFRHRALVPVCGFLVSCFRVVGSIGRGFGPFTGKNGIGGFEMLFCNSAASENQNGV